MDFDFFFLALWKYFTESFIDLIALFWFLFCWIGYSYVVDNLVHSTHSLAARMHLYRLHWMQASLNRENRIMDVNIVQGIQQSTSFFASTSILIIAGFLAMLSSTDTALDIIREIPFATQPTLVVWYMKITLMVALFIYAFFKYTWALRQLNYSSILIGALPGCKDSQTLDHHEPAARRAAMVLTMAARHMNRGLRTYYFAIGALSWFVNPWVFMLASTLVVLVLYKREYSSDIVHILNMPSERERPCQS